MASNEETSVRIIGINMTNFFTREMFMYSLGDIRFKKPISLKKVGFTMLFFAIWTFPLIQIFGLSLNPLKAALYFLPPIVAGNYSVKPVFGGKTLIGFAKSLSVYVREPKGWTDLQNNNEMGRKVYYTNQEIWVGRRRELQLLADLRDAEKHKGVK